MIERWNRICEEIEDTDYMTVEQLVEKVGASPATIRRDLISLEKEGRLQRFRGGVRPVRNTRAAQLSYTEAFGIETRMTDNPQSKQAIGRKAASLIQNGDYIYIDTSSTTSYILDYLEGKEIAVVTNAVLLLPKLFQLHINTYVPAGNISFESGSIVGEEVPERIRSMNFSKVFLGSYGVDPEVGFTTYDTGEGQLKAQLLRQCKEAYVLADHTKFGVRAFYTFGSPDSATVITDSLPSEYAHMKRVLLA